ncbi:transcriptional regulator, LacI family [Chitinophaga costaii]|uniref:Transcriptional regulator, LacI family n=1 Tax=Chitinophaga costaii TaxID=1335309 RepID=A0A1C3ZGE6_9BACT|nr:substrate-binding domain-containing protein [Chitinophaga costaii]PUZ30359.1 LacI family transcriptional regulator [Chitinophaga costaii]SCB81356.1 transcriptional regulator, LacI family [Chitinophaga costaii]
MKGISIKDIAKQAGVSPTTVSFVLNGKGKEKRISETVIKKINRIATKLKYRPNQLARGLRTGKTKTIGLIVEDIANPFFSLLAKVVEDEADKSGYKVLYSSTEDNLAKAQGLLEVLKYRQVDGYIITPTKGLEKDIEALQETGKPLILIDRYFPAVDSNYVVLDNFQGAYDAASHLVNQGYKNIGIITTTSSQVQMSNRFNGFEAGLTAAQAPLQKQFIKRLAFDQQRHAFIAEMKKFFQTAPTLDAVFFATNYLGIYGIEAIRSMGLQIGKDIGMISFDDHDIFRLNTPSISCVAQPIEDMGSQIVKILMDEILQATDIRHQVVMAPTLLIRESTGGKDH